MLLGIPGIEAEPHGLWWEDKVLKDQNPIQGYKETIHAT